MVECLDAEVAFDLLERRLSGTTLREVETHLEGCEACRQFMAELVRSRRESNEEVADTSQPDASASGSRLHSFRAG